MGASIQLLPVIGQIALPGGVTININGPPPAGGGGGSDSDGPLASVQCNLTATTDPSAANDNTQGYSVASVWVNTTSGVMWVCTNTATGAAVWTQTIPPQLQTIPADLSTFITALGGNSQVVHAHTTRMGVAATLGQFQSWADCRGAGFGAPIIAGTNRPWWNPVTQEIYAPPAGTLTHVQTTNGAYACCQTADVDISAGITLIAIGTVRPGSGGADGVLASITETSLTRLLAISCPGTQAAPSRIEVEARGASTLGIATSTFNCGATRRLIIAQKNSTTTASVSASGETPVTATTDAAAAGNLHLSIFDYYASNALGAGSGSEGDAITDLFVVKGTLSGAQITAAETYAAGRGGV